jgi:hypothetical protein
LRKQWGRISAGLDQSQRFRQPLLDFKGLPIAHSVLLPVKWFVYPDVIDLARLPGKANAGASLMPSSTIGTRLPAVRNAWALAAFS